MCGFVSQLKLSVCRRRWKKKLPIGSHRALAPSTSASAFPRVKYGIKRCARAPRISAATITELLQYPLHGLSHRPWQPTATPMNVFKGLLGGSASLGRTCEELVPNPLDAPPIRSPQRVHTLLATELFHGKDIVEIGTRNGDGMGCFALHARKATAIEYSKPYCISLENRSEALVRANPGRFGKDRAYEVACSDYRTGGVLDADYITWWERA